MEQWTTGIMNEFGYIGIFALIALENVFPPIPSEVILTFGGFMTTTTEMTVTGVIVASTLGSICGAVILYGIGRLLDVRRLEAIIAKYGRILRLKPEDVQKANDWFQKYGAWTVLFCRLVPLIRSLISIPASSTRMNMALFLALTTVGSLVWNVILINVGAAVGASWETIVGYMDAYSNFVYAGLALLVVLLAVWFVRKRWMRSKGA